MSIENLAKALAAFQEEMPTVGKTKTATIPTKSGPGYKYQYADLADLMRAAGPVLAKHGLSFAALPKVSDNGAMTLEGRLLHSSGEYLAGSLPIAGGNPQQIGSSLTYMRRYLLGCLTGIVTDDDDDGHAAMSYKPAQSRPAPAQAAPPAPALSEPPAPPAPPTQEQVDEMDALVAQVGVTEDQLPALAAWASEKRTDDLAHVTRAEMGRIIGFLHSKREQATERTSNG